VRGKLLMLGLCGCMAAAPAAVAATAPDVQQSDPAALTQSVEAKLRAEAAHTLRAAVKTATHKQLAARRRAEAASGASAQTVAVPAALQAIAQCESSGDPTARSGPYGGLFQFDQQTWASVGGSGDPAAASPAEQQMRAAMLYQQRGTQAWPVCGAGR
jgi:hypothetical protein